MSGRRTAVRVAGLALLLGLAWLQPVVTATARPGGETVAPSVDIRSKRMHPPTYPLAAFRAGAGGTVQLRVRVDAEGRLQDVQVESSSGRDDLDVAAMDAARQWTYAPGRLDGTPVAGSLRIPVDYSLDP